jgi:UbiD family decarboxylase
MPPAHLPPADPPPGHPPPAHLDDLAKIIERLDAMGRLIRVRSEVDPEFELAAIAAKFEGGPRAMLFERVKGYAQPIFIGLYWSRELLGALMETPEHALPGLVSRHIRDWQQSPVDPVVNETGPVLEVSENEVDLYKLPVPVHAADDGSRYFDAAVLIARDPETGVRNASIQRLMVVDKDTLAVNIDAGRHLELYLQKAAAQRRNLPFTVNVGVGPGLHFAASAPAEAAPAEADELGIASAFHGAPLALVPGRLSDVEMVANAMYALECELLWDETEMEGPFAEVTGYYAARAPRGKIKVKAIHRRANPVFHTILSGTEVHNSVGLLGEANVLNLLQRQVPGVRDVYFSHGGCGFYGAVVQLTQTRQGWSKQAILAAFAAFPPLKIVTVVDDDVDIRNPSDVEWAMATRLDPKTGIVVFDEVFGHGLNPSFPDYLGAKVGFDATQPFPFREEFRRAKVKEATLARHDIVVPDLAAAPAPGGGAGGTLKDYILARIGAGGKAAKGGNGAIPPAPANGADGGATQSLKDYILARTSGPTNGPKPAR